jgi:hypothetical protein
MLLYLNGVSKGIMKHCNEVASQLFQGFNLEFAARLGNYHEILLDSSSTVSEEAVDILE